MFFLIQYHSFTSYYQTKYSLGIAKCISSKDSWTNYRGFSSDMSTKIIRDEVGCGKMIYLEAELQICISDYIIYRYIQISVIEHSVVIMQNDR